MPGHRVLLLPELRHPERVDHVERGQVQLRPSGRPAAAASPCQVPVVRVPEGPGELLRVTLTCSAFLPARRSRARTIALTIADRGHEHGRDRRPDDLEPRVAVDRRAVGVVVGRGPELDDRVERAPRRRARRSTMQIAVVNQKTKSIRSASFEASGGSHGRKSATAVGDRRRDDADREQGERWSPCAPRASLDETLAVTLRTRNRNAALLRSSQRHPR